MNKIILIAKREIAERFSNRFYRWLMVLGPLLVLGLVYLFLTNTSQTQPHWNVLVMDKNEIFENKLAANKPENLSFDFINAFLDYDEFGADEKYKKYDLAISINEKILSNKHVIISYKVPPPEKVQHQLVYLVERRLEELMVKEFTDLSVEKFRDIKQSLTFNLKDTYDPKNELSYTASWVGFVFGGLIILFVFMFGMTILRSVAKEKANRIVEVLLSMVKARQLLAGKIVGIGTAAIAQFLVWMLIIAAGLLLFRMTVFPDIFSGSFVADEVINTAESQGQIQQSGFVELIYSQIHYTNMLVFFLLFFIGGFLFYGSFFAMIGAAMGSESDGQQFIIPISMLLLGAVLAGYYGIYNAGTGLAEWLSFIPFTSPMNMIIRLANGFEAGATWKLFLALLILFLSAIIMLIIAGRVYKNGLLRFNHRLRLKMLFAWTKK